MNGDPDELAEVANRFVSMGATLFAAETWCDAAAAFERAGRTEEAQRCVARAQLLGAGRLPPTPSRRVTSVALTNRQAEIVTLVLDGMTARDVATRLSLSIRTVENHVATVYRNLGVSNREQLAAAVGRATESLPPGCLPPG